MENEYQILSHLEKNQDTSQRQIANRIGLSVGTVNLLLKRMVRKGLIKMERLNAKTLRYIITPQGMLERNRLAYQYMKGSYQQFLRISRALENAVAGYNDRGGEPRELIFCGSPDEVLEILKIAAESLKLKFHAISGESELVEMLAGNYLLDMPSEKDSLNAIERCNDRFLVITWLDDVLDLPKGIEKINILKTL